MSATPAPLRLLMDEDFSPTMAQRIRDEDRIDDGATHCMAGGARAKGARQRGIEACGADDGSPLAGHGGQA